MKPTRAALLIATSAVALSAYLPMRADADEAQIGATIAAIERAGARFVIAQADAPSVDAVAPADAAPAVENAPPPPVAPQSPADGPAAKKKPNVQSDAAPAPIVEPKTEPAPARDEQRRERREQRSTDDGGGERPTRDPDKPKRAERERAPDAAGGDVPTIINRPPTVDVAPAAEAERSSKKQPKAAPDTAVKPEPVVTPEPQPKAAPQATPEATVAPATPPPTDKTVEPTPSPTLTPPAAATSNDAPANAERTRNREPGERGERQRDTGGGNAGDSGVGKGGGERQRPAENAPPQAAPQAAPVAAPTSPAAVTAPQPTPTPDPTQARAERRPRNIDDLKGARRQRIEDGGRRTVIEEPGRTIVKQDNRIVIQQDETARMRRAMPNARFERGRNGGSITTVDRPDNQKIISETDDRGQLVRRFRRDRDGRETSIIDNRRRNRVGRDIAIGAGIGVGVVAGAAILNSLVRVAPPRVRIPRDKYIVRYEGATEDEVYDALNAPPVDRIDQRYTLDQVRATPYLRERMRRVDLDDITFDFGSWEVNPREYQRLERVAAAMRRVIRRNPDEVFLIEGYTDAVGSRVDNLTLSDRRAETVADILSREFQVPFENLATQGFGEDFLKIRTEAPERFNRRVAVRRVTPLISENRAPPRADVQGDRDDGSRDDRDRDVRDRDDSYRDERYQEQRDRDGADYDRRGPGGRY